MKVYLKISSSVVVLCLTSSMVFAAETAGAKGSGSQASVGDKSGCPVKPKLDPKTAKACPKDLGEIPLNLDQPTEYEVEAYHPETESYSLLGVDLPDEGEIPVTLEALAKSDAVVSGTKENVDKVTVLKKALTSPCDLLNKKFKIKNIQTLSDKEIKARANCVRK